MNKTENPCGVTFNGKEYPCPVSMAMNLIGGKWKGVILYYLKDEEKRYNELRKKIPGITEMTLSIQLKQLEKDQLINRSVYGDKPPIKVIYKLTELGETLIPILNTIADWSDKVLAQNSDRP